MTPSIRNHGSNFGGLELACARDLCMPGVGKDVSVLVSVNLSNSYSSMFSPLSTLLWKLSYVTASPVGGSG
jgi:hypothetical protein